MNKNERERREEKKEGKKEREKEREREGSFLMTDGQCFYICSFPGGKHKCLGVVKVNTENVKNIDLKNNPFNLMQNYVLLNIK